MLPAGGSLEERGLSEVVGEERGLSDEGQAARIRLVEGRTRRGLSGEDRAGRGLLEEVQAGTGLSRQCQAGRGLGDSHLLWIGLDEEGRAAGLSLEGGGLLVRCLHENEQETTSPPVHVQAGLRAGRGEGRCLPD